MEIKNYQFVFTITNLDLNQVMLKAINKENIAKYLKGKEPKK